jgi:hypothetical protein
LTASDAELKCYSYPPRPKDPAGQQQWAATVGHLHYFVPSIKTTNRTTHHPYLCPIPPNTHKTSNTWCGGGGGGGGGSGSCISTGTNSGGGSGTRAYWSPNWGGYAAPESINGGRSYNDIYAYWYVPCVNRETYAQFTAYWVGLGGDTGDEPNSGVIWQGGEGSWTSDGSIYAWYENYGCIPVSSCPSHITYISNFPLAVGDWFFARASYSGNVGTFTAYDITKQEETTITVTSLTTTNIGQVAEAIAEQTGCGNPNTCTYPGFTNPSFNNIVVNYNSNGMGLCQNALSYFDLAAGSQGSYEATMTSMNCGGGGRNNYGYDIWSNNP